MRQFISKTQKIHAIVTAISENPEKREEIAREYNFKNASTMDSFLRRAGYVIRDGIYVLSEEAKKQAEMEASLPLNAVAIFQKYNSYIDSGVAIPMEFHKTFGFATRQDMQDFLKKNNVLFNPSTNKYEMAGVPQNPVVNNPSEGQENVLSDASQIKDPEEFVNFLFAHKDLLLGMMEQSNKQEECHLPVYNFKGKKQTRSFYLSYSLCLLIDNYCDSHGVKIVDLLTIALAEFFQKYGYTEELKQALGA